MTRTALFGDSYIKRLGRFCDHFLGIPGDCSFYGVGGMRADSINKEALRRLIEFHPHTVCVCLGGNDISTSSTPKKTYEDIIEFVKLLENSGVNTVYVCEIMTRGKFLKTPGLDKKTFDKKRKLINDHLRKKFGQRYLSFPDIHFPKHYDRDGVHLSETTTSNSGMKKFQCRLARVMCRH